MTTLYRNPKGRRPNFNAEIEQICPGLIAGVLFVLWLLVSLAN